LNRKLINDSIYNHIECSDLEEKVLETKILNRLFFITQNALAFFAYPSINTKRYIHSLGAMHMVSHMFKNSFLNANEKTKNIFLKALLESILQIIQTNNLQIDLKNEDYFRDKTLNDFTLPIDSQKTKSAYLIVLQALRLAALLHDVGHLPFSHQCEYALQTLYKNILKKDVKNNKELEFLNFYNQITKNNSLVLHEALGLKYTELLFKEELDYKQNDYIKLLLHLIKNIYTNQKDLFFDYKILHEFIDSTIDADRLDYINRDMLASGYITGAIDFIRIAKVSVLVYEKSNFHLCFFDNELMNIEQVLEMRFNLYKKIIFNYDIAATDTHLENVILYLAKEYFQSQKIEKIYRNISMIWRFLEIENLDKRLDVISQLDENWLITILKKEYFKIKNKKNKNTKDNKYIHSFEEVLFGKKFFSPLWKNLSDLFNFLDLNEVERYTLRESLGASNKSTIEKLTEKIENFRKEFEKEDKFISYQMVSINIGIKKDFSLYDGNKKIQLDIVSTLRKRLKQSLLNTVPFYLYTNNTNLTQQEKNKIKEILFSIS
jgi:HD superfamily phosphohydrolase